VTRAAICAEIAATGKRVIDAATGAPVACAAAAVTLARTPVAASVAASAPRAVAAAMRSMRFSNPFTMRSVPASNPAPETVRNERINVFARLRDIRKCGPTGELTRIAACLMSRAKALCEKPESSNAITSDCGRGVRLGPRNEDDGIA